MLYIVEYLIAYKLFTKWTIKKPWGIFIIVSASFIISFFCIPESKDKLVLCLYSGFAAVILSFFFFCSGSILSRLKKISIVLGLCFCIEYLSELLGRIISEITGSRTEHHLFNIRENIITIAFLIIITIIITKLRKKYSDNNVPLKNIMLLMIILTAGVIITILSIDNMILSIDNKDVRIGMLAVASIFTICVEGLILLIIFLQRIYDHQRKLTEQVKEMAQMEKRYFEDLLARESETRKFRHDIKNHFLIIQEIADEQGCKDLLGYLDSINIKKIYEKNNYETGNTKLNALTNYYLSFSDKDILIDVTGTAFAHPEIDEASLYVIYGNLLKNAVEAVNEISTVNEKHIIIEFAEGNQYFRIRISNTINEMALPDFITKKKDKKNHGLGLINVREAVKKLDGVIKYELKEGLLAAEVTLPIINDVSEK